MIRICSSMTAAGYDVTLVGRKQKNSLPLLSRPFRQHRLSLWFQKGKLFYLEYQIRLFLYLLFQKMDGICAIDLDSILPVYLISRWKRIPRLYDAHELFCEMQEVVTRPGVYRVWKAIERFCVPRFAQGYTVNQLIADEFHRLYGVNYEVIRNLPVLEEVEFPTTHQRIILYQGAVNEGRCFETLIPAMAQVDAQLLICGEGNFMPQALALVKKGGLEEKVRFKGAVLPEQLRTITRSAWCGITLFDRRGKSNYYSLANRFFDYIHAGIPQLAVNYPAYREINNYRPIAVLIDEPGVRDVADALNELLNNTDLYYTLVENCKQARLRYNWQEEEKKLIRLYHQIFG
ncbi:MAG: glycosyltransferase [Bacteroidetes bacterium]|nr:glycosyltransferase [Bacteroidota bacterium]